MRSLLFLSLAFGALAAYGQEPGAIPTPAPTATPLTAAKPLTAKDLQANPTAEAVVETSLFVYAIAGGRPVLNQIRKTTQERGKTTVMNAEGRMETADYNKYVIRGETTDKDKLRFDHKFPSVSYSLLQVEDKTFGIYNDSRFAPTEEASRAFTNNLYRCIDSLLRYKENGSTIAHSGKEKVMGVEYNLVDLTDKAGRKTRYFVSTKTFRVMMLEYEDEGKTYRRKFYDYNYVQGTLVPNRTVLYEGDKIIEETNIGTVTFGQKIDDAVFPPES